MKNNIFYLILVIFILFLSRIIPHPPNFTPILGTAIMAPALFKSKSTGILVIITSMFISDIVLGFHSYQIVIYLTIIGITLFASINQNYKKVLLISIAGSTCFFITTNFAVWAMWDFYEKNFYGLYKCYLLALPFFGNTLISTVLFSSIILIFLKNLEKINEKFNYIIMRNFNKLNKY